MYAHIITTSMANHIILKISFTYVFNPEPHAYIIRKHILF